MGKEAQNKIPPEMQTACFEDKKEVSIKFEPLLETKINYSTIFTYEPKGN